MNVTEQLEDVAVENSKPIVEMHLPNIKKTKSDSHSAILNHSPSLFMPEMNLPKFDFDKKHAKKAIYVAKEGLSALAEGLSDISKETIDDSMSAKDQVNTTTAMIVKDKDDDDDMNYKAAFEKVEKAGKGFAKLFGVFGGIVKESVTFIADEVKSKNKQNLEAKRSQTAASTSRALPLSATTDSTK